MGKLSDIYGTDSNEFAEGISSDALRNTAGPGPRVDQSARSKGASGEDNPDVEIIHDKGDSRAKTKGNS
jgi:hypothetical protein